MRVSEIRKGVGFFRDDLADPLWVADGDVEPTGDGGYRVPVIYSDGGTGVREWSGNVDVAGLVALYGTDGRPSERTER